jgi:hypothetical protein
VVDDDGDSKMEDEEDEPVQPSALPSVIGNEDDDERSEDDGAEEGEEEGSWVPPESEPTSEKE